MNVTMLMQKTLFDKISVFRSLIHRLFASDTRRRLLNGALWGGFSVFFARLIVVGSSFFLARILGKEGFGEYGAINATAGMLSSVAGLGIGHTVVKHIAELKLTDPVRAGRILALSSVVTWISAGCYGAAFVVLAPWLATKTLAAPHLAPLLQISALTVTLGVLNSVQSASLAGCEAYRQSSCISVGVGILQSIMVVFGAYQWGLKGVVFAMVIGMVLTIFFTHLAVRKVFRQYNLRYVWQDIKREGPVLVHYSLPAFLTLLFIGPVTWITTAFLANQPNGYAELGILNAATQWEGGIQLIAAVFCTALIPVMSEKAGKNYHAENYSVLKKSIKGMFLLSLPLIVILSVCSPIILAGYGAGFLEGRWTFITLILTGAVIMWYYPLSNFLMASGKVWRACLFHMLAGIAVVTLSWWFVHLGAVGIAVSRLIGNFLYFVLAFVYVFWGQARLAVKG